MNMLIICWEGGELGSLGIERWKARKSVCGFDMMNGHESMVVTADSLGPGPNGCMEIVESDVAKSESGKLECQKLVNRTHNMVNQIPFVIM